jgi:hypothetical protein
MATRRAYVGASFEKRLFLDSSLAQAVKSEMTFFSRWVDRLDLSRANASPFKRLHQCGSCVAES